MSRFSSKETTIRQLRVGEQVRHSLFEVFNRGDIGDPLITQSMLTVSEVRMSVDLRIATVFISLSNSSDKSESVLEALNGHARFIRGCISPALRQLRYMPTLRFKLDNSNKNMAHIDALLALPEVKRDLIANGQEKSSISSHESQF